MEDTKKLLYGGVSGVISRTLVAPLDRTKILMQTTNTKMSFSNTIKYTIRNEGILNMWKGNLLNCLRIFPYSGIQFGVYDILQGNHKNNKNQTYINKLCYGSISGSSATIITHPIDVIRHRIICYQDMTKMHIVVKDIYLEKGLRSYYKGLGSSMCSLTPFIAINLATYDHIKSYLKSDSITTILYSSSLSALLSQGICYPLDTIKRRMQLKDIGYKNGLDVFHKIILHEGYLKLYSGMLPNIIKIIPNNCLRFLIYELIIN